MEKIRIPKSTEQHTCSRCNKLLSNKSSLVKHLRIHTGEKPYSCQINDCGQKFTQVSNLIRHKRTHLGLKPYTCEICNKSFTTSTYLRQHKSIHKTIKSRNKFVCFIEHCCKSYLYLSTLKKHVISVHKHEFESLMNFFPNKNFLEIYKNIKNDPEIINFLRRNDELIYSKTDDNSINNSFGNFKTAYDSRKGSDNEENDLSILKRKSELLFNLFDISISKFINYNTNYVSSLEKLNNKLSGSVINRDNKFFSNFKFSYFINDCKFNNNGFLN